MRLKDVSASLIHNSTEPPGVMRPTQQIWQPLRLGLRRQVQVARRMSLLREPLETVDDLHSLPSINVASPSLAFNLGSVYFRIMPLPGYSVYNLDTMHIRLSHLMTTVNRCSGKDPATAKDILRIKSGCLACHRLHITGGEDHFVCTKCRVNKRTCQRNNSSMFHANALMSGLLYGVFDNLEYNDGTMEVCQPEAPQQGGESSNGHKALWSNISGPKLLSASNVGFRMSDRTPHGPSSQVPRHSGDIADISALWNRNPDTDDKGPDTDFPGFVELDSDSDSSELDVTRPYTTLASKDANITELVHNWPPGEGRTTGKRLSVGFDYLWKRCVSSPLALTRSKPRPGYERLQWTCTCGREMYGDYTGPNLEDLAEKLSHIKHNEGPGSEFTALADSVSCTDGPAEQHPKDGQQLQDPSLNTASSSHRRTSSSGSSASSSRSSPDSSEGSQLSQVSSSSSISLPTTVCTPGQSYLELCVKRNKYHKRIGEIPLVDSEGKILVNSDFELFGML